jgi:WD40 repeat protein/Flp pilus assembly protein TadD
LSQESVVSEQPPTHDPVSTTPDRPAGTTGKPRITVPDARDSAHTAPYQAAPDQSAADLPREAGAYRIEGEIGHGGMGVVFRGHDPAFDRTLAVKVLRDCHRGQPELERRFLEEAHITGQLQHPGIAPVHAVGRLPDGRPFFSMKLIQGRTLAQLLGERSPGDLPHFLSIFVQVCQTLAYAHSRGVLHRDVKPGNVMVGAFGEVQVMDWGLAKVLQEVTREGESPDKLPKVERRGGDTARAGSASLQTQAGAVIGTFAYVAPEQARGEVADDRADVFSLGATLCEILTGQPPYTGPTNETLWSKAQRAELGEAHARLDACGADAELIALAKRCLAAERGNRPRHAGEVAQAVATYLAGVEERARQAEQERAAAEARSVEERKRRRVTVGLLGVSGVAALALVGLVVGTVYNTQLKTAYEGEAEAHTEAEAAKQAEEGERKQAEAARKGEEAQRKKAEAAQRTAEEALTEVDRVASLHSIFLANLALRENSVLRAKQQLEGCKPHLRGWEWHYLNSQCHPELYSFPGFQAAFSPDGALLAALGPGGVVRALDAWTGREVFTLKGPAGRGIPVFSSDGTRLAVVGNDGVVRVYDARTGKETLALKRPAPLASPTFSPDGTRLAVASASAEGQVVRVHDFVRVYDARTGEEVLALKGSALSPTFSPDGTLIAADGGSDLRVYNAKTGLENFALKGLAGRNPIFSPDGALIAARDGGGVVHVYDARTGKQTVAIKGSFAFDDPVFSPDGTHLAISGLANREGPAQFSDGVLRMYDVKTGRETLAIKASPSRPTFSPDGMRIAIAPASHGGDGVVRVYDARTGQETLALKGPVPLGKPTFSPDGARLAVGPATKGGDGMVRVYDARTGQGTVTITPTGPAGRPQEIPHKHYYGQEAYTFRGPTGVHSRPVFTQDGTRFAAVGNDQVVRVYDARTGQEVMTIKGPASLHSVVFSPDGSRLVAVPDSKFVTDGMMRMYDTRTGQETLALKAPMLLYRPVFSPDGSRLAILSSINAGEKITLWEAPRNLEEYQRTRQARFRGEISEWHRDQVLECQRTSNWSGASFHVQRLSDLGALTDDKAPVLERLAVADVCARHLKRYDDAVRLYTSVFSTTPKLAENVWYVNRYNGACVMVLVAAGKGKDADKLDGKERVRLRQQALAWLRGELEAFTKLADKGNPTRLYVQEQLSNWLQDGDLASVREAKDLAALPDLERQSWEELWTDVAALRKTLEATLREAEEFNKQGLVLARQKKLDEAVAAFRKAIELRPNYADAYRNLGDTLLMKRQPDDAILHYRKAIDLDPKDAKSHGNLGVALFTKDRLDDAILHYQKAIDLDPKDAQVHTNLGNALQMKGQLDEAIARYRKAIDLDPKYPSAHGALGFALLNKGRFAEARDAFRQALALVPKSDPFHALTTQQLQQCERLMALDDKLSAVLKDEAKPADAIERLRLGMLCRQPYKKRYAAAARFYADAFTAEPKLADDLRYQHRYHAAVAAALAAAGKGEDAAKLPEKEQVRLRKQALDWLRAQLAAWANVIEEGSPEARPVVQQTLAHWQRDADLASLRDKVVLAKLPETERAAFVRLWADVDTLLKKARKDR